MNQQESRIYFWSCFRPLKSMQMLNNSGFEPFFLLTKKARLSILKREQDGLNLTLGRVISMLLRDITRTVFNPGANAGR